MEGWLTQAGRIETLTPPPQLPRSGSYLTVLLGGYGGRPYSLSLTFAPVLFGSFASASL